MAEKNEKLGMLLLFDCIAVILSTFGVLVLFQMINHESDINLMIISCFFVGIKILLMGIGDITGIAKKLWVASFFIVLADVIVFAINILMAFGISKSLIGITVVADVVLIMVSHLVWGKVFGSSINEKKERKAWLSSKDDDTSEDEYDDIFASLVTKDGGTDEIDTKAVKRELNRSDDSNHDDEDFEEDEHELYEEEDFEEEEFDDYEEEEFDTYDDDDFEEVEESFEEETGVDESDEDTYLDEEAFKNLLINEDDLNKIDTVDEEKEEVSEDDLEEPEDELEDEPEDEPEEPVEVPSIDELLELETEDALDAERALNGRENFTEIEERLGSLLAEINVSTRDTEHLEASVAEFRKELDHLIPITTDTDILKTGDVIRDKLKTIIDKQFIVDEVLDDLIRLSKQINKRIDDLDDIENGLNKRKEVLDQKELLFMNKKATKFEDIDVQILPEEVILEDEESEIIIDQGDWETIKAYLKEHPEV